MIYSLCLVLIAIGLYGALVKKNVVKIVISIAIMEYGINLLLILVGTRILSGGNPGTPPIMDVLSPDVIADPGKFQAAVAAFASATVDPLPQALVLTSIVISLGVLSLMVAICIRLYERYGTFDITEMRRLRG